MRTHNLCFHGENKKNKCLTTPFTQSYVNYRTVSIPCLKFQSYMQGKLHIIYVYNHVMN